MHACDTSKTEDRTSVRISPKPMLKALSWLARIGQIHSLIAPLANPLVRAFASPQQNRERKEALPLILAVLAAWEQKVCSAECTLSLRIALGSCLLAAHSMRFGDIQRIRARDISLTQHALRGSCWATKTTKLGQPWACTLFGLTGRDEKSSWVLFWLRSLSISVTHSAAKSPDLPSPDFVLPAIACIAKEAPANFQSPMAYTQALAMLRRAAQLPWLPRTALNLNQDEAQAYTLRSLKVALLSASAQLRLPEESRRQQGHRRLTSVQLHSRGDTIVGAVADRIRTDKGAAPHDTPITGRPACSFRTGVLSEGGSDTHKHHAARIALRAEHVRLRKGTAGPTLHYGPRGLGCARSRLLQRLRHSGLRGGQLT